MESIVVHMCRGYLDGIRFSLKDSCNGAFQQTAALQKRIADDCSSFYEHNKELIEQFLKGQPFVPFSDVGISLWEDRNGYSRGFYDCNLPHPNVADHLKDAAKAMGPHTVNWPCDEA
jgi:hypothetical protein